MSKILRVTVSLALLGWLASRTDWQQVEQSFRQLRLELWLAAFALFALTQFVSSCRWQILARGLGLERSRWQLLSYYFIGMYFNLVLPTSVGGDVVRVWYLDRRKGKRRFAFISVFSDRLSGFLALFAIAVLAAAFSPIAVPAWVTLSVFLSAGAVVAGLLSLPVLLRFHRVISERFPFTQRYFQIGTDLVDNLPACVNPAVMFLSLIVQSANVVIVWLIGLALGLDVPASYYWVMVPMVTVITLLPSINGMGVREAGMALFLAPIGIPEGQAISLSFLWFCVTLFAALAIGGSLQVFGKFSTPKEEAEADSTSMNDPQRSVA